MLVIEYSNANFDNIVFTINDTTLCVPVVTLLAKNNRGLSECLNKWFERSALWNKCKTKSENKNMTKEFKHFLESNFVGVNRLFILIFPNEDNNPKMYKTQRYYLTKGIIKNYNVIIIGKNFSDQPNDSDIKQYEEIKKLTTEKGEEYSTGCLLDYDYIKNYYRLIAVDLIRQEELDRC